MRTNSFKCKNCGDYTRHVEISLREVVSMETGGTTWDTPGEKIGSIILNVEAGAADLFGLGSIHRNIVGITPYKCCKCGRCAWRKSDGEEKEYIGYSK